MGFTNMDTYQTAKIPIEDVKGGLITLVDKKVWQGVVRHRETNEIMWICDHLHSRPEYNARSREDPTRRVWEYSALNCGKEAASQWERAEVNPRNVTGAIGMINDAFHFSARRDDSRTVMVGETLYMGWIKLEITGDRVLWVKDTASNTEPASNQEWPGAIFPDRPTDNSKWPDLEAVELNRWLTAAGLLLSAAWGLTFQTHRRMIKVPGAIPEQILRLTPKPRASAKKQQAHIRPIRRDGKRLFEIVDRKGNVVMAVPHRGKAAKELKKLEGSTP